MSIRNFFIFIALCVSPLLLAQSTPSKNSIYEVAQAENVPNRELEKAYIAYMASYQYGKLLEFEGCEDFGELFDNMRLVTTRLKYVTNAKLSDAAYEELKSFEDKNFGPQEKAEFLDKVSYISSGLRMAMEVE